MRADTPPIWW